MWRKMLHSLGDASRPSDKTKIMYNDLISRKLLVVNVAALEVMQEFVYFGQTIQLSRHKFEKEANRRFRHTIDSYHFHNI